MRHRLPQDGALAVRMCRAETRHLFGDLGIVKTEGQDLAQTAIDHFKVGRREGGIKRREEEPRLGGKAIGEGLENARPAQGRFTDPDARDFRYGIVADIDEQGVYGRLSRRGGDASLEHRLAERLENQAA